MTTKRNTWIFLWVFCSVWSTLANDQMERITLKICEYAGEKTITDKQVISVSAPYRPNVQGSPDHCDVGIRAQESNRRLEYLIDKLTIFDCGITIWIYDNPQLVSQPTRKITCDDDRKLPLQGKTSHGVIKISLIKQSTQAKNYEFQIHVKTDYGPPFDFERDSATFYEQPLETGAIVGIVIAGSVLIIAVAGLAIYCCLKARMNNQRKNAEASEAPSTPSVYTSGTSRVLYQPTASRSNQRGGHPRSTSQDSSEKVSSKHKTYVDSNDFHAPHKDINSHTSYKDTYKNRNETYENEERLDRQASFRSSQKRRQHNTSIDDADHKNVKGGHISRRDSSRGSRDRRERVKYDKKTKYSRHDDYGSVGKGKKQPANGHWRSRSRSPNPSQGSVGSTVDSNVLVYGYSRTAAAHPSSVQDPHPRSRSGSRSRSRTRPGSQRSGSVTRSRTGSLGRSDARGRSEVKDGRRPVPKNVRQYGDMSDFLPEERQGHRSRSRSASVGRSHRR